MKTIRLATRGSRLAKAQANLVKAKLEALGSKEPIRVELLEVTTRGDRDRIRPLSEIGGSGLFVRGIEEELLLGNADIAVHSAKDLPYELADGLIVGGIPEAADMRDVLISKTEHPVLIGTGSPRRRTELLRQIPRARFAENRGNITTRLKRLCDGEFDAIVLAKAGLDRLKIDLSAFNVHVFRPEELIPAPCQGILAVECRRDDDAMCTLLGRITDPASMRRFTVERYLFAALRADCSTAVGASAQFQPLDGSVIVQGMLDGKKCTKSGPAAEYRRICEDVAGELRRQTP